LVGVVTDTKLFLAAQVSNAGSTERDHVITVPMDRPVQLRLVASGVTLTDSTGAAAGGADITVRVNSATANSTVVFTAAGLQQ